MASNAIYKTFDFTAREIIIFKWPVSDSSRNIILGIHSDRQIYKKRSRFKNVFVPRILRENYDMDVDRLH